jgi:membrane protein DedA with SNARE-associated domain
MNPIWAIVAIILGVTLYRQFDFETLTIEKPALAAVYLVTFIAAVYFLIKGRKRSVK